MRSISALCMLALAVLPAATVSLDRLHSFNGHLIDSWNRTVLLRGVNQVNKRPPFTPQAVGFDARNVALIASLGHKVVRLGVCWEALQPTLPGPFATAYLHRVFETIGLLKQYGIYTLIDIHQDAWSAVHGGYGAPAWASLGQGPPNVAGFPLIYFGGVLNRSVIVDDDFDALWQNRKPAGSDKGLQTIFIEMLQWLAGQIDKSVVRDAIVGLELINEPFPGKDWIACTNGSAANFSRGCTEFDSGVYTRFVQAAVNAIRQMAADLIIFYDANALFGLGAQTHIGSIADPASQLAFSWHNYMEMQPNVPFVNAKAQPAAVPFMTEFGANTNRSRWDSVLALADAHAVSWTFWAWSNNPAFKFSPSYDKLPKDARAQGLVYNPAKPLSGNNTHPDAMKALARPYPLSTPGRLVGFEFKPSTRSLVVRFEIAESLIRKQVREPRSSVIVVPKVVYPAGYECEVDVASDRVYASITKGADVITILIVSTQSNMLAIDDHTHLITVHVTPKY